MEKNKRIGNEIYSENRYRLNEIPQEEILNLNQVEQQNWLNPSRKDKECRGNMQGTPYFYGGNQYGQGHFQYPKKKPKGLAITSMVVGILAIIMMMPFLFSEDSICCTIALLLGIVALPFGVVSLFTKQGGTGMAIAGVVLSSIILGVTAIGIFLDIFENVQMLLG